MRRNFINSFKIFLQDFFQLNQSLRTVLKEQSLITRGSDFPFISLVFSLYSADFGLVQQSLPFEVLNSLEIFFLADRFFFHDGPYKKCSLHHFSASPSPREMDEPIERE